MNLLADVLSSRLKNTVFHLILICKAENKKQGTSSHFSTQRST